MCENIFFRKDNMKIKMSKSQWERIGRSAGWIKKAQSDIRDVIIDFDRLEFIERLRDVDKNSTNTWNISYNNSLLQDDELLKSLPPGDDLRSYIALFNACNFSAGNIKTGQKMTAEELAKMIYPEKESFRDIIRESDDVYRGEREIEKRDIEMGDSQDVGDYEKYGPDPLVPQY